MKEKSIYKQALALAVPMMIQSGITNAVGLVDNIMVGKLGTESMTAVSIVGQLIFVFNLAIFGGLSGPGIYGAQYFGQGNMEGVKNVFRLKWWISIGCVIVGTLVFILGGDQLIMLYLHETAETASEGIDAGLTLQRGLEYLQIMLLQLLPFAITQIYAGSLRETGESIKPMVAGLCSVVVDIVFNYILIYGKFGAPRLEVRGAALATVLARLAEISILLIWAHRSKKHDFLAGIYKTMKLPKDMIGVVLKKSVPIFLNEFLWAGGVAVLTQCYSLRGLSIIAGMNISNAICNLMNVVFIAMGNAVGILTGQMLGAGKFEKAKKDSLKLMWFTGAMCLALTVVLVIMSGFFPDVYDTTDEVKYYGTWFIRITAFFFPIQGFLNALYFTIRSGGKTLVTFLFDSVYSWVVCVPIAFVICKFTGMHIFGIYVVIQSLDFIKVIIGSVLFKKGVWIQNLVQ